MPLPPSNATPRTDKGSPSGCARRRSEVMKLRTLNLPIGRVFAGIVPGVTQLHSLSGIR